MKQRLINANKLRKDFLDLPNCYNGYSDTYDKSIIIEVVDEQPTIEAIPIDFIKQTITDKRYILARASEKTAPYYEHAVRALESLLWEWGKTNG